MIEVNQLTKRYGTTVAGKRWLRVAVRTGTSGAR